MAEAEVGCADCHLGGAKTLSVRDPPRASPAMTELRKTFTDWQASVKSALAGVRRRSRGWTDPRSRKESPGGGLPGSGHDVRSGRSLGPQPRFRPGQPAKAWPPLNHGEKDERMNRRRFVNLFFGGSFLATVGAFSFPSSIPPSAQAVRGRDPEGRRGQGRASPIPAKIFRFGSAAECSSTRPRASSWRSPRRAHLTCTVTFQPTRRRCTAPATTAGSTWPGTSFGPAAGPARAYQVDVAGRGHRRLEEG
jgi:hypothetical protein